MQHSQVSCSLSDLLTVCPKIQLTSAFTGGVKQLFCMIYANVECEHLWLI